MPSLLDIRLQVRCLLSTAWGPMPAGAWLLVAGAAIVLYSFNLGGARALTEHEIYVAGVAKQMDATGEWLLPRVGDRLWLEKPPLPHWLATGASRIVGGFSEASVRMPSVVSGVAVVLVISWLAARWFGPVVGVFAGFIQATSVYAITYARLAEADMLLCALVVSALAVFACLQPDLNGGAPRRARTLAIAFWVLMGLTNLAKGPLFGAGLLAAVCLAWLATRRDLAGAQRLWSPAGLVVALAIAAAWPAAVAWQEPAALELWREHLLGRATGEVNFNEKPFWYYATCWPWQLLPWTPLLLLAAPESLRRAWRDRAAPERFLWCWALVPVALLSLSKGKHHHYLIYALPALSPVAAVGAVRFCRILAKRPEVARHWANLCLRFFAPAAAVGGIAVAWRVSLFRADALVVGGSVAALCVAAAMLVRRQRALASMVATTAVVVLLEAYAHGWILPRRDPSAADRDFLTSIDDLMPNDARVVACGGGDVARHIFYVPRPVEGHWETADVGVEADRTRPFYVIARARTEPQLGRLGRVKPIAQSEHTRRESGPSDRYTLFLIEPVAVAAAEHASPGHEEHREGN